MIHYYEDRQSSRTLVLFHGTGADEHDLVPLARDVAPDANILSLRGRVNEGGMLRFFKRYDYHTFDLDSINLESDVVLAFIKKAQCDYKLGELILLGYSNGASMIEALLEKDNTRFSKAVLLQPGYIKEGLTFPQNKGLKLFVSVSDVDPYLLVPSQKKLLKALEDSFDVNVVRHGNGHSLTMEVLMLLANFLND